MAERSLCAQTQAEALKYRLLAGLPVRRAAYAVIRSALEAGAKGCEVIVSGKLRQQRANAMKFKEGYMIKTGNACKEFVDEATRHVLVKQGMLGVKVRIMKPTDPEGRLGPKKALPDIIVVHEPKEQPLPAWKPNQPKEAAPGRGGEGAVKGECRVGGIVGDMRCLRQQTSRQSINQSHTPCLHNRLTDRKGERGLQLTAVGDLELRARTARLRAVGLQSLHDFHSLHHLAEHHMMTVQMRSGDLGFTHALRDLRW